MFCIRCGAANDEASLFCIHCGQPLAKSPAAPAAAPGAAAAAAPAAAAPPPAAKQHLDLIESLTARLNRMASTDKLEGFSLGEMFSEVFKRRSREEVESYLLVGTAHTTPRIQDVPTGWPKPWFFLRVLIFLTAVYGIFVVAVNLWPQNLKLYPGTIVMGGLAVPMATFILFFELNTPRNVSFYSMLVLVFFGGVMSMLVTLLGFDYSPFSWMGVAQAGIVEEIGKLLTVILLMRQRRYKYILNGLLFGAAVGAGFAAFETAGFAFKELWTSHAVDAMNYTLVGRSLFAPFGHVAWTAIAAGAFWRVKGDRQLTPSMFVDARFWKAFLIPILAHMAWDFEYIPSIFYVKYLVIGVVTWYVVFAFVQQGLHQVRDEQKAELKEDLRRTTAVLGSLAADLPRSSAVM